MRISGGKLSCGTYIKTIRFLLIRLICSECLASNYLLDGNGESLTVTNVDRVSGENFPIVRNTGFLILVIVISIVCLNDLLAESQSPS